VVEDDCALADPVTPWNLKHLRAALGSNRIGLDLRWSRLALLSCWPGLQSDFETNVINSDGRAARCLWKGLAVLKPCLFLDPTRISSDGQFRAAA
jgi:hypothetical protein